MNSSGSGFREAITQRASSSWIARAVLTLAISGICALASAQAPVSQTYNGDVIQMNIDPLGRPDIYVKPSTHATANDPYIRQYYTAFGSTIFMDGVTNSFYSSGYSNQWLGLGTLMTGISNTMTTVPGGTAITTVTELGSTGIHLTQTFTHLTGTRYVSKTWTLENMGTTTHTDMRFMHGGDTYFGNNDSAYGFYDPANSMVFLRNQNTTDWGIMGYYANPATPADHYYEGNYYTGIQQASAGQLNDTISATYVDAGYQLQWNRASFAPGDVWTISATEVWTPASDLQVLAPTAQNVGSGSTATLSFTVQNLNNSTPLTVSLAASSANNTWTTSIGGGSTRTIQPNHSISVTVSVNVPANATGSSVISLAATSGNLASNASATLTSTALNLSINPSTIDFGSQVPGATVSRPVTVTNNGSAITLGNLATTAPFGRSADTCSGHTLGNESSCSFTATFAPTADGTYNAVLNIPVTAPVLATRSIALSGTASTVIPNVPAITLNPTTLTFATQAVGTTSAPMRSVLTNSGTAALVIDHFQGQGEFSYSSDCPAAPNALLVGDSCNIDISYSPLSAGLQNFFLYIYSNVPGAAANTLPVSGQGAVIALPRIAVTPNSLTFTDRVIGSVSNPQSITVTNSGTGNLNLSAVNLTGAGFQRVTATPASADCGAVVGPQTSCQIAIVFAPAAVGAANGSVAINHNAQGGSINVSLSGNGMPRPQALISFNVTGLNFSDQIIGTVSTAQTLKISNVGTAALNVSSVGIAGADASEFALAGNCNISIAPGANCTLTVNFKPLTVGAKVAQLSVSSNAQNDVVPTPALSGNAVPVPVPIARVSATSLGFGNVIYGGSPSLQGVTLGNIGSAPLVITGISFTGNTDFAQTNTCGASVAAGGQCSIGVTFTPHALGARAGVLVITTNAAGSPHKVNLGGTGCRYFSPAAARFFLTGC